MKSMRSVVLLLLAVFLAHPMAALGQAETFTLQRTWTIDEVFDVPCLGEQVQFTGELHDLLHVTEDSHGGFHVSSTVNPQGLTGTGLTSGETYHGTGATRFDEHYRPGATIPSSNTHIDNTLLIGPGPGNNLYLRSRFHVTVSPNGELTVLRDIESVICR